MITPMRISASAVFIVRAGSGLTRLRGKRFPQRGNRRRPPSAACGATLKRSFCHPHRAVHYRRAYRLHIRRYEACFGEHGFRYVDISRIVRISSEPYLISSKGKAHFGSDQKARLSSRGGTAKRFSFRKPPQACGLRHRGLASRTAGFAFRAVGATIASRRSVRSVLLRLRSKVAPSGAVAKRVPPGRNRERIPVATAEEMPERFRAAVGLGFAVH